MSRVVCYISKDGQVATCIRDEVKCHLCNVRIPDDARSSIRDKGDNLPSEYQRGYEEGAKAERERVLDIIQNHNDGRLRGLEILFNTPSKERVESAQDQYLKEAYFELTLVKHLIESLRHRQN